MNRSFLIFRRKKKRPRYSRFILAIFSTEIPLGHSASQFKYFRNYQNLLYPFVQPYSTPLFVFQDRLVAIKPIEKLWHLQITWLNHSDKPQRKRRNQYRQQHQMLHQIFFFQQELHWHQQHYPHLQK